MTARITRLATAPTYTAPLHEGVLTRRLQGHEAGQTDAFWVGHSTYPPGSRALTSPAVAETVYVCVAGRLELTVEDGATAVTSTLGAGDSVHLTAGTIRGLANRSDADAYLLVVIAQPTTEASPPAPSSHEVLP